MERHSEQGGVINKKDTGQNIQILNGFASKQLKQLDAIEEIILRTELKHICHYILERNNLLSQRPSLAESVIKRIQWLQQRFGLQQDYQLSTLKSKNLMYLADFSCDNSLLKLIRIAPQEQSIFIDRKSKTITSSLAGIPLTYTKLNEQDICKITRLLNLDYMTATQYFSFKTKSPISKNLTQQTNSTQKQMSSSKFTTASFQPPRVQSALILKEKEETALFLNLQEPANINTIETVLLQFALSRSGCTVPIRQISIFENNLREEYLLAFRERHAFTLKELLYTYEKSKTAIPERILAGICIDLVKSIQIFHEHGFMVTSISPSEVAFYDQKWILLQFPFAQKFDTQVLSGGYFDLMSPQLQSVILLGQGKCDWIAGDYYNIGALLLGCAGPKGRYSQEFTQLIDTLTSFQSRSRLALEKYLQLFEKIADRNIVNINIYQSQDPKEASQGFSQAILALGSKSLALENILEQRNGTTNHYQLFQKAYVLQRFGEYPDAITYYQKAEAAGIAENQKYIVIPINNNIGNLLIENNKHKQAVPYFQKAVDCAQQLKSKNSIEYANSLENLANAYIYLGQAVDAEKAFMEVLLIKQKLEVVNSELSISFNNLAVSQEKQGKYPQAIGNFKKCIEIESQNGNIGNQSLAELHQKVGLLFSQLPARKEDALLHLNQALKIFSAGKNNKNQGALDLVKKQINKINTS